MLRKGPVWAVGAVPRGDGSGIDAAVVQTDGRAVLGYGESLFRPFDKDEADVLAARDRNPRAAAEALETALAEALAGLAGYQVAGLAEGPYATLPIAPGIVAEVLGVPVVTGLEDADSEFGGQGGAVAAAFYHARARAEGLKTPVWVVECDGQVRLTLADPAMADPAASGALNHVRLGPTPLKRLEAMGITDAGPGGALREAALEALADGDDRPLARLSPADARATLVAQVALTVAARAEAVSGAVFWCAGPMDQLLSEAISAATGQPIGRPSPPDPTALPAMGYGFAAVRTLFGLPTAFPGTTGVAAPVGGGFVSRPGGLTAALALEP